MVERAQLDIERKYNDGIKSACEATVIQHPARECARDFLNWVNNYSENHSQLTADEFCLEVFTNGLSERPSYVLPESEAT